MTCQHKQTYAIEKEKLSDSWNNFELEGRDGGCGLCQNGLMILELKLSLIYKCIGQFALVDYNNNCDPLYENLTYDTKKIFADFDTIV